MQLSPATRVHEYRQKGWWRGETVDRIFQKAIAERSDAEALVDPPNRCQLVGGEPRRLSWRAADDAVNELAAVFADMGARRGDVVATQLPNVVEGVLAFLACARLGAILSPVAVTYRAHELRQILPAIDARLLLTVGMFHGHNHAQLAIDLKHEGVFHGQVLQLGADAPAGALALDPLLRAAAGRKIAAPEDLDAAEVLTICWTSGTESKPKGVPRHHDHWVVNGEALVESAGLRPGDTVLNPFPLINIAAFGGMVMPWLMAGGRLVQHHPFDLPMFLRQLEEERVSYTVAPPAVLNMLLKSDGLLARTDISNLRCLGSGSAPLAPWMVRGWQESYGVTVMNIFGSNEGASLFSTGAAIPDPEQRARFFPRFGVAGFDWRADFPTKLLTRLVDLETGEDIDEPARAGELRISGAMTFDGYLDGGDLNLGAFDARGYFRTGDLFEIAPDEGGRFYRFVGRCKEIIIRGGQNISPAELDALIESHPRVKEASCAGWPDERLGERVCAVAVLKAGETLSLDDLCEHLRAAGIAAYKLPEKLRFMDALPRNALGKVLRRELSVLAAT